MSDEVLIVDGHRAPGRHRCIFNVFGNVEAHVEEADLQVGLPLRLVWGQDAGWRIEMGRYDLDAAAINRLRVAIEAYDQATGCK